MSKQKDNISQIRKYLSGELDARAMHNLERQALDDPFLMDAIEGYEKAGGSQQENLDDLSARLQRRIEKKKRRLISWRYIPAAAVILAAFTIGGFWLFNKPKPDAILQTAQVTEPAEKKRVDIAPGPVRIKSAPAQAVPVHSFAGRKKKKDTATDKIAAIISDDMLASEPPPAEANPAPLAAKARPSAMLKEVIIKNYGTQNSRADSTKNTGPAANAAEQAIIGHAAGINVTSQDTAPANLRQAYSVKAATGTVRGTVTAKDNGQPIAGAVVRASEAKFGTVTDANGKFILPRVAAKSIISITYIGYNTKKINPGKGDSLNVVLSPSGKGLNEVVALGYGTVTRDENGYTNFESAHPAEGWPALKKYLKQNAVLPDGTKGKVKLSFTVDGSGDLSDFKILKSLNKTADDKAIGLIKNGPEWVGQSDRKPKKVTVSIAFQ